MPTDNHIIDLGSEHEDALIKAEIRKMYQWMLRSEALLVTMKTCKRVNIRFHVEHGKAVKGPFVETVP